MKKLAILLCSLLLALPVRGAGPPQDPLEISRRLDLLYRSTSSRALVTMELTTPNYERTLELEIWSRGMEDTLATILSPPRERGTATLKKGGEMWNFLPKIGKTIRIPPSMMSASWMGSDFSNDDLMRETSWEEDYTVAYGPNPPEGGAVLVYTPRPDAPVAWARVVATFNLEPLLPLKMEYYDEKERLVRLMEFADVGELGGRHVPRRLVLIPLSGEKKGRRTVLTYTGAEFDLDLPGDLFTLTRLRRGR